MSQQPPQNYPPQNTQPPFSSSLGEPYSYPDPTQAFPQQPEPGVANYAPQQPYYPAQTPPPKRGNFNKIALIVLGSIIGFLLLLGIGIAATRGSSPSATVTPSAIAAATLASTSVATAPAPTPVLPSPTPPIPVVIIPSPSPIVAATPTPLVSTVAPAAQVVTVTDPGMINVRAMPNTSSEIVTQMSQGDDADVIEPGAPDTAGGPTWIHISFKGQMGYIRSDIIGAPHVKGITPPTATAASATVASTAATNSIATKAVPTLAAASTRAAGIPTAAPTATKAAGTSTTMATATVKR